MSAPGRSVNATPLSIATARADAAACGVPVDAAQAQALLNYLALLQRWNTTYNLTAIREPAAMWRHHVLDCLAAVPAVARHLATLPAHPRPRVLDVGSGGGLPGIVWALAMPQVDVVCVDTVGKKAAFIRQAAGELGLGNLQSRHSRVEQLREPSFNLVTSRAFSSLADLLHLTRPLLAPDGCWVALKGKRPDDEMAATGWPGSMFHVEPIAVPGLDAERCLVWICNAAVESSPSGTPGR